MSVIIDIMFVKCLQSKGELDYIVCNNSYFGLNRHNCMESLHVNSLFRATMK